ncbi:MAG: glycerophosphodiester phosphodiesterase, partial [Promethearchaeota archaeon]
MDTNVIKKVLIFAHRGASSVAPENTSKAFKKAMELQADYIEFDVHQSEDGEIVIIHDGNTLRTTGHFGVINKMTL